jgi:hypothetical protein
VDADSTTEVKDEYRVAILFGELEFGLLQTAPMDDVNALPTFRLQHRHKLEEVSDLLTFILFTARAPHPLTNELVRQGYRVYETIVFSEVCALAESQY